jgi:hypothetical protein
MGKLKLDLKWVVLIVVLTILANAVYNFYHPSMNSVIELAESEWKYYGNRDFLNLNDFKGPVIDLTDDKYYIFRWERIIKNDSININIFEVNIGKNNDSEEPFITAK